LALTRGHAIPSIIDAAVQLEAGVTPNGGGMNDETVFFARGVRQFRILQNEAYRWSEAERKRLKENNG
jgi:hypothetical protein